MSKRKNNLQIVVNIYLLLIFIITFVVGFFFSTRVATIIFCILLIPFLLGQALVYGLISQIRGMEMILKNPPKPGEEIDLSIYYRNHLLVSGPEPFVVEYPKSDKRFIKNIIGSADAYGPLEVENFDNVHPRRTKPTSKDFEDIYHQAEERNITDLHEAYDLWVDKYPQRVEELGDAWSSFKHGMETQERLYGKIFDRGT
jgi:hypothetical protein